MEIVILDGFALNENQLIQKSFADLGEVRFYERTPVADTAEILRRIGNATAVITNKVPMTAELLAQAPFVKYIGVTATGYNIIDLDYCRQHGITVTNIPQYSTEAVAQFTFALLLEIASQVGLHSHLVEEWAWVKSPDFCFWRKPLMELQGKTMGLVGFGAIAQAVSRLALAFGMKVIFYNHRPKKAPANIQQVSLEELLTQSDIVSLHVPLFPETAKLINSTTLKQMKPSAILLNTSRGGLIDEEAVAQALQHHLIAAYGADVVAQEPMAADNPLLGVENCYLTPHIAWAALETRARLVAIAVENLRQYQKSSPQNVVS
ncbi:D-2-hydroxyacid dehydrogenase [Enterococcus nangangensis]